MSEAEEKYNALKGAFSTPEHKDRWVWSRRGLAGNETVITWHDPEEEKPSTQSAYLVITSNGRWHKAYFEGYRWWDIGHSSLPSVVLFGTFDLPELPEVKA